MIYIPARYKKILTLAGGVLIQLTLGYYYTFGNLNPYLTSYLRELVSTHVRYSNSIWINSTMAIAQSVSSALGGLLVLKLRLSLKLTTFIGCVIMSSGIALTFFAVKTSFALTLLTHGLMNGLGMGFAYVPPMSLTMRWFPDHRGMAMALLLCGYGCGGIIFTQLQTLYINRENLAPDEQDPFDKTEYYFSKEKAWPLLQKVPSLFLVMGAVIFTLQVIGMLALFDPNAVKEEAPRSITVHINDDDQENPEVIAAIEAETKEATEGIHSGDVNSLGVVYGRADTGMTISEVVRTKAFYMIWFMYAFTSIVPGVLSAYYKTFGEQFIDDDKFLTLVGSLASVCNATGRIFWGFLIERFPFKINILLINTVLIVFTATLYLTQFIKIPAVFLLWICSIYFTFCGIYVIMPIITARCFGQKNFTLIYGLVFTTGIFANLGTSSLASLKDPIGWFGLFLVLCGFAALSWIIAVFFDVKKSDKDDI